MSTKPHITTRRAFVAAAGFGGVGLVIDSSDQIDSVLAQAKEAAADGKPVLVNVHLATSDFRKGSISM